MHILKKHIVIKAFLVIITTSLFLPAAIKFVHVFEHHQHKVCNGNDSTHLHQVDLDCEFFKFQLNHHFILQFADTYWLDFAYVNQISALTYKFLNNHRQLSYSLRGPPVLV